MSLDDAPKGTEAFNTLNRLVQLQTRGLEIQEEDLVNRAAADKVSADNKKIDIESALGDFDINIRKSDRAIREQWISTTLGIGGLIAYSPGGQGASRPLTSTIAFVRGLISIHDAYKDRSDLIEKRDKYLETSGANAGKNEVTGIFGGATKAADPSSKGAGAEAAQAPSTRAVPALTGGP